MRLDASANDACAVSLPCVAGASVEVCGAAVATGFLDRFTNRNLNPPTLFRGAASLPQAPPLHGPIAAPSAQLRASGALHVRKYRSADWFTPEGVFRKRREIESKGLPDFDRWRFITLTLDPDKFGGDPLAAFLAVRPRLRYFMTKAVKVGLWSKSARWCWKLEFQSNGWPHWHLLVERTSKMSETELATLGKVWGFGRTNVEMVRGSEFVYSFKYAFKPAQASGDDDGDDDPDAQSLCAPAWFLDFYAPGHGSGEDAVKPVSFQGVRFWQTSMRFYTGISPAQSKPADPVSSRLPAPVRDQVERIHQRAQVVARSPFGKYIASAVVLLSCCYSQISNLAAWHWAGGGAAILSPLSYVLPLHVLEQNATNNQLWNLQKISSQNRLSVLMARRMEARGISLNRC